MKDLVEVEKAKETREAKDSQRRASKLTKELPREEQFELDRQSRRSARSLPAGGRMGEAQPRSG